MKLILRAMKSTCTEALESELNFAPRMAMNGRTAMNGSNKTLSKNSGCTKTNITKTTNGKQRIPLMYLTTYTTVCRQLFMHLSKMHSQPV